MSTNSRLLPIILLMLLTCSCHIRAGADGFPETFETGSKRSYAAADVALASGTWRLDRALIGKSTKDRKDGAAALRFASGGTATMMFDVELHTDTVRLSLAPYGDDGAPQLALWWSSDSGKSWQRIGTFGSREGASLQIASLPLPPHTTPVRFSIRNEGQGRADADDFDISSEAIPVGQATLTARNGRHKAGNGGHKKEERRVQGDDNIALGNPSDATPSPDNKNNYLLVRPQYTLSYNDSRGIANWVSWHLGASDEGSTDRCNCFMPDAALPAGFYRATTSAYISTGFDRGHLCPSGDRSASADDNAATFLLSNIAPQAPFLNEQTWERLEAYSRTLTEHGMELYIIAGAYGTGGSGRNGGTTNNIAAGRITVPARFWKIIIVLPEGDNDLNRITAATRVIVVDMPNIQAVNEHTWNYYRTTIAKIEAATGYHFLSNLPEAVRTALRDKMDVGLRSAE